MEPYSRNARNPLHHQPTSNKRATFTPRIEPDPWWRAITATWPHLKDPFGFLRFALVRALSRGPAAADAQRVRDEICERFKQDQLAKEPPGQLLTPADFQLKEDPSTHLDVGREITLARLRDRQYMALTQRLNSLYANLFEYKDISQRELRSEVQVFWLSGRSGAGKSVLLLQTLERLVCEGWRVLWLKGDAELLEPALRAIKETHEQDRPDFIAIDDLYDRDARNRIDLSRLGEFIDESDHQNWPMILTCGPTEFADSFEEDATYRGFNLNCYQITPIAAQEAEEIEAWYQQRTCKPAQRGTAFTQAAEEDNGLFISLAVELAHGDLKTFAQRFARRVQLNDLNKALLLPLALNRLYLRAPFDWLAREDREKLATLNHEGDFNLLETADEGQIVRLTHPHLANALYLALRKPANNEAYTNDLVDTFHRALTEQNANLVSQLLRLFSGREQGMAIDRLSIVKLPDLALKCAKHWHELPPVASDADSLADMATSWACWATTAPNITSTMETKVLSAALNSLEDAHKVWPICWQHLAKHYPKNEELFSWAVTHLSNPLFISHPTWSFVWEHCLQHDPNHSEIWHNIGLEWLQCSLRRPDWHIVWQKLLPKNSEPDWEHDPILILGRRRLRAEKDGPDWAFVLQDLLRFAPNSLTSIELVNLAHTWLTGREDRAEWAHVWRALLGQLNALPESLPLSELLQRGATWLTGREDRAEWSHVWRALLEQRNALPESLPLSELLQRGATWLTGREDRAEWAHVWQALLEQRDALPESLPLSELLQRGATWLTGREDRADWAHVWQDLLELRGALPESLPLSELLQRGATWLTEREDRAEEWGFVCERLLEQQYQDRNFFEIAANWLTQASEKPEWPLLSAKFIVAAPHHTASKKLAVTLAERIKVKPNSGNCLKTEELTADLAAKGDLPKEVNDWLQALRARKDHPAWAEVRRSFNEGLPIKGRTIRQQGSNAHTIELENGLLARYLISRNDRKLTKSDTCDFFVQQINPDRDFIQVGLNKAPQLKIGTKYDGLVREYKEYGVFVMVDGQQGLLHRSQYSNLLGLAKKFPTGSQVCVEIVALSDKGPQLRYAGPDLAAEVKAETLTIGQVYKACINGIQEYGLFLQIGVHSGLLHRTRLPPNTDILRQYAKGRQLDVQVVEIKDDGKLVFKLAE